jgi:hypothetical protein
MMRSFIYVYGGAHDRRPLVFILRNQKNKEDEMFMYFPQRLVLELCVPNAAIGYISAISWWSALLVKETGVPRENQQLVHVTHKLYHWKSCTMYIWQWAGFEVVILLLIDIDCIGICKARIHMITATVDLVPWVPL